jgi:hypothetical protein
MRLGHGVWIEVVGCGLKEKRKSKSGPTIRAK